MSPQSEAPVAAEKVQTAMTKDEAFATTKRALETLEILEMILLKLPMRDLLLAEGVGREWKALITSSVRLRRALFREQVSCGSVSWIDWRLEDKGMYDDAGADLDLGPALRGPEGTGRPQTYAAHWGKTRTDQGDYRIFVNPLLAELFPVLRSDGIYFGEKQSDLSDAADFQFASWKTMYFTQPPIRALCIERDARSDDSGRDNDVEWTESVLATEDEQGLQMLPLLMDLMENGRAGWIEGREKWIEYTGVEDLQRVVAAKKPAD